jgi:YidC/Oxa1 family membrane protein insertase
MNIFNLIFNQPLANGLMLFYNVLGHNFGVATIVFSTFLFFITRPLIKPQLETAKKIKELQPLINKLKSKYGKDQTAFMKAQAELYKQKGINPTGGCLPLVLQIIIFLTFSNVFNTAIQGTAKFNEFLYPALKIAQGQELNMHFWYANIAKPDLIMVAGIPFALPGLFFVLIVILQFLSGKIMSPYIKEEAKVAKVTKTQEDDMQVAMQQSMAYTLPLMYAFFGYKYALGSILYLLVYVLGNIWTQVGMNGWGGLTPAVNLLKSKLGK